MAPHLPQPSPAPALTLRFRFGTLPGLCRILTCHCLALPTPAAVEFALIGTAESLRGAAEPEKRIYPGGAFDPIGLSKGSNLEELKVKEIKNGRLAMLAFIGFVSAHAAGQVRRAGGGGAGFDGCCGAGGN